MKRHIIVIVLAILGSGRGAGQSMLNVYPGDVTNNGEVNNLDFLYMGLAYNFAGPARDSSSLSFDPKPATPWSFQFPGGLNMAYADCNGDGVVNYYFDAFPLYTNYGQQRSSNVTPDVFVPGLTGIDPPLQFSANAVPSQVSGGQSFTVPIEFGTAQLPVEDLYGVAFSVEVDPLVVDINKLEFNFTEASWANPDNDRIWMSKKASASRVDVAWVRTDRNQKRGYGKIGYADFVIVVDVLALSQPSPVVIDRIKTMDKFGNYATVAGDTIWLSVAPEVLSSNDDLKSGPAVSVYPNPANEHLSIRSEADINCLTLTDLLGKPVYYDYRKYGLHADLTLPKLPAGMYLLRIDTEKGPAFRQIRVQP